MIPDPLPAEMAALFDALLPKDLASRYSTLLSYGPSRWAKIDPWKVWEHIDSVTISEWKQSTQSLLASPPFARYAAADVTVLRCGHEGPKVERLPLTQALVGKSCVFEGFISVVPSKLGIAINHDGLSCILIASA
jgi:hypothetical protein